MVAEAQIYAIACTIGGTSAIGTCAIGIITILNILVALHLSRVLYKSTLFLQNKPNLLNAEMNVSYDYRKDYENKRLREHPKNKANSNPIQTQTNPIYPYRSRIKANFCTKNPIFKNSR